MGIQSVAIERYSDMAEPLCAPLTPVRELVVSIPAPGCDHRKHEDPALAKQVLISGMLMMLEKKELALSMRVPSARVLDKELAGMEARVSRSGHLSFGTWREGEHDDVVMATALACWRARWRSEGIWGTKSLGLEY